MSVLGVFEDRRVLDRINMDMDETAITQRWLDNARLIAGQLVTSLTQLSLEGVCDLLMLTILRNTAINYNEGYAHDILSGVLFLISINLMRTKGINTYIFFSQM